MKKNCIFWMFAVLIIAIGMTACGNNDDENSSGKTSKAPAINFGDAFDHLPLPIAERFLYMDAIGYAPGTTISTIKWGDEVLYWIGNPLMNSIGFLFYQDGTTFPMQGYYPSNGETIVTSPITTEWESSYPGGYQIFKLTQHFANSYEESHTWNENILLGDLPDNVANKLRTLRDNANLPDFMLFKGIWQARTVYYFKDESAFAPFESVYDGDGHPIKWADNASVLDFVQNSSNWKLLYVMNRSLKVGCEGDHEHLSGAKLIEPIALNDEQEKFFATEFSKKQQDEEENIHTYYTFFDQKEWEEEKLIVINTTDMFKQAYMGNEPLPDIDFDRYTLIIGKDKVVDYKCRLDEVQLWDNGNDYTLDINILYYGSWPTGVTAQQVAFYYRLYPKLDNKTIYLNRFITIDNDKYKPFI